MNGDNETRSVTLFTRISKLYHLQQRYSSYHSNSFSPYSQWIIHTHLDSITLMADMRGVCIFAVLCYIPITEGVSGWVRRKTTSNLQTSPQNIHTVALDSQNSFIWTTMSGLWMIDKRVCACMGKDTHVVVSTTLILMQTGWWGYYWCCS